jgi:hypothetical protein
MDSRSLRSDAALEKPVRSVGTLLHAMPAAKHLAPLAVSIGLLAAAWAWHSTSPSRPRSAPPPPGQRQVKPARSPGGSAGRSSPTRATESVGPWGVLQSYPVFIAAPDAILDLFAMPSEVTTWIFRGLSAAEVMAVLDRPGLPAEAAAELLDKRRWQVVGDEIRLSPSNAAVRSLPADVRAGIYDVLARWEDNEFQHSPYDVPEGDVRAWLAGSHLPSHLIDAVARTAYPVGEAVCFSDLPLLVSLVTSGAEGRLLLKALSRTRTVILRVRLDGPDDTRKVGDYWGAGDANAKDFVPLLESVATNPEVRHLDLVHLLPPSARRLLYTFPQPAMALGGRYPDCHWTSLNFFRERPEPRLADSTGGTMFTLENLRPGEPPFVYGDVLFLTDAEGRGVHSCVYLAADYVFTKNGANVLSPWVIMTLEDVRHRYGRRGPVEVKVFRR